jgi:hypothetical protein
MDAAWGLDLGKLIRSLKESGRARSQTPRTGPTGD